MISTLWDCRGFAAWLIDQVPCHNGRIVLIASTVCCVFSVDDLAYVIFVHLSASRIRKEQSMSLCFISLNLLILKIQRKGIAFLVSWTLHRAFRRRLAPIDILIDTIVVLPIVNKAQNDTDTVSTRFIQDVIQRMQCGFIILSWFFLRSRY